MSTQEHPKVGFAYRVYLRLPGKRFAALGGSALVGNLIYAEIFECPTAEKATELREFGLKLGVDNGADVSFRVVKNWMRATPNTQ